MVLGRTPLQYSVTKYTLPRIELLIDIELFNNVGWISVGRNWVE